MSEFDDLGRWLEGEWKTGRALKFAEEMGQMFPDLNESRTARRLQELQEAQADPVRAAAMNKTGDEMAVMTMQAQVLAENVLLVVATYLAKHGNDPQSPQQV